MSFPKPMTPERTLTGTLDDGRELLIEVYPDGIVTAATKDHGAISYGPPVTLLGEREVAW